jgi:hypothetical protein
MATNGLENSWLERIASNAGDTNASACDARVPKFVGT